MFIHPAKLMRVSFAALPAFFFSFFSSSSSFSFFRVLTMFPHWVSPLFRSTLPALTSAASAAAEVATVARGSFSTTRLK